LSQAHAARKPLPARTGPEMPRPPPKTEDSGIDMRGDGDGEEEEDYLQLEPSSSPLIGSNVAPRPEPTPGVNPSVKGRRMSMLPVPSHSKFKTGIDSVIGQRTNRTQG
jgi:hypothetical protein